VAGLHPKKYHAQVRHSRAEALLFGGRLSIKEIAVRLGFHSAAHFSVEFKKRAGRAPSIWMRQSDTKTDCDPGW
jgi:AraC-like DNA-binding protein